MLTDYGLQLVIVMVIQLRRVPMGLSGPVGDPFFILMDRELLITMDSGLLLEMVQTVLRRVLMELLGPVGVLPFFLVTDMVSPVVLLITLKRGLSLLGLCLLQLGTLQIAVQL